MTIKVDLTAEPYFGIIRRWAFRTRRSQRVRYVPDWQSPELGELAAELVGSIVQMHMVTEKELARLTAAVHHTLVQLGANRMQQISDAPRVRENMTDARQAQDAQTPARMRFLSKTRRRS